jgi:choline dehydrogenase-like flavoprotein
MAFSETPNPTKFQKTLGVHDFYFGDPSGDGDWPYPLGAIQMNGKSDAVLAGFDAPESEDPAELARHALDFWLTTEDLPLPENRVMVDRDGRISLRYTPTNVDAQERLIARFKGLLDVMRCKNQIQENRHYWGGRFGLGGVAHQNGTVRFGTDPSSSALNVNCRMHELDNLYVVDSSFFVSSTSVNPTLTIIANSLRVAEHIAQRLGSPPTAEPEPLPAEQPDARQPDVAVTAPA